MSLASGSSLKKMGCSPLTAMTTFWVSSTAMSLKSMESVLRLLVFTGEVKVALPVAGSMLYRR